MTSDEDTIRGPLRRRRLLQLAAAASATGLAGCSVSTPFGDFEASGGDDADPTPEPTTVTTTRESTTRTTETPTTTTATESTPSSTTTTAETTTSPPTTTTTTTTPPPTTTTRTPTTTTTTTTTDDNDDNDDVDLDLDTVPPCVLDGSCVPDLEQDPVLLDPVFVVEPEFTLVDIPPVGTTPESSLPDPEPVSSSGDITVTVTPDGADRRENTAVGDEQTERNGDMICTTQRRRITAGGNVNFLLNPETGTIWPGAILDAESMASGAYAPALTNSRRGGRSISQVRTPIELSISLRNVDGKNTRELQTPSGGRFRTALDDLLSAYDRNANTPAAMNYTIHQVHSSKQLDIALGAHYQSPKLSIENQFDFSSSSETNKLLVEFYQRYYSVGVSLPNPLADGFVTDEDQYLRRNDVIVNNVEYGRVLLFAAESRETRQRIKNALDVGVRAGMGTFEGDLDIESKRVLRDLELSAQVLGGSAQAAAGTISEPGQGALGAITDFIQDGATYDPKASPGVPIAYQTKYLGNFATANTYLTTTYSERNCRPTTRSYRVHNVAFEVITEADPGNEEEIYGDVYVVGWPVKPNSIGERVEPRGGRSDGRVWHRSKSSHVNIREGQRKDLNVDAVLQFPDAHELSTNQSYIQVTAIPHEKDPTSGDEFGNKKFERWFLSQAPSDPDRAGRGRGTFSMRWNDRNSELALSFDVSPLPP